MYATGVTFAVHEQRVRLYCFVYVIAFEDVINWCLTQYEVVILSTCIILLSECTTMCDDDSALIFVCLMYGTVIGLALKQQRVRFISAFVLQFGVLLAFDAVRRLNLTLIVCCCQIPYNGNGDSALIFVRRTGGVLALNEQAVRLYCCVCVRELERVSDFKCSMGS